MPLYILDEKLWFPPVHDAVGEGLLAIGGDLSTERLLLAYKRGIFPWYESGIPLWWCPDPRFVLFPHKLKISKSMRSVIQSNTFRFSTNTAFDEVITNCRSVYRKGQSGTWINEDVVKSYCELHEQGYAYSAEAWKNNVLVGGLYGLKLGDVFFGESMFSFESNASKFALISLIEKLKKEGLRLVDCQVYTPHLESMGAEMISRKDFIDIITNSVPAE